MHWRDDTHESRETYDFDFEWPGGLGRCGHGRLAGAIEILHMSRRAAAVRRSVASVARDAGAEATFTIGIGVPAAAAAAAPWHTCTGYTEPSMTTLA